MTYKISLLHVMLSLLAREMFFTLLIRSDPQNNLMIQDQGVN